MELDRISCWRALLARDARFDGLFFTCVKTTRIFCRPVCPARTPKLENCRFVRSPAEALAAGFRACLRCRPELSPELGPWRQTSANVARALALIEDGFLDHGSVDVLAGRVGIGSRQLRRLFIEQVGAAPVAVAQTRRVLLARQLIADTDLGMTEIGLASGFGSIRRFNECFRSLYGRPPGALRRHRIRADPGHRSERVLSLLLPYRPPYDWAAMLAFLALRAIPGVERVHADRYARVIDIDGRIGVVEVSHEPARSALRAEVRIDDLATLPAVRARLRRLFDLGCDPVAIADVLKRDPALAPLVDARPGLRVPGAWDRLELAVRAVLGQQITVTAATRLAGRIVAALGRPLAAHEGVGTVGVGPVGSAGEAPRSKVQDGLTHAFPRIGDFDVDVIRTLGMPGARAEAIAGLAQSLRDEPSLLDPLADLDAVIARLRRLPGIGDWTANYIAMRALRESDAFLVGDVALQRILAVQGRRLTGDALRLRAEIWRPWRAYAVLHLWTSEALGPLCASASSRPSDALAA